MFDDSFSMTPGYSTYLVAEHVAIEWPVVILDLVILMQLDRALHPVQSMSSYPVKQPSQFQRLRRQHKSTISGQEKNQQMVKTIVITQSNQIESVGKD